MLAIVGYPTLGDSDADWIESCRDHHDPQASRIRAHVTLVFPLDVAPALLLEHALAILPRSRAISFVLRRAESVPDPIGGGGHVLLVPEEGHDEIVDLHDRLYSGPLRPYLRPDLPFVPHLTVGRSEGIERCRELAAEINRLGLRIQGTINAIDVIDVGSESVTLVSRMVLESGSPLSALGHGEET